MTLVASPAALAPAYEARISKATSSRHPELATRIARYEVQRFFQKRTDQQLVRANLELERSAQQRAQQLSLVNEAPRSAIIVESAARAEQALSASQELNERLIDALPRRRGALCAWTYAPFFEMRMAYGLA